MEDEDKFKLYVKCSMIPKNKSLGACTVSHRLMMILMAKDMESQVITKNENTQFTINSLYPGMKIPFLKHRNFVNDDVFAIEDYLDSFGKTLDTQNAEAKEFVAKNKVFMRFSYMVKNVDPSTHASLESHLNAELQKLDSHLEKQGTRFAAGPELTLLDCTLLPQLLHLRVAAKEFCDYEIPEKFEFLRRYIEAGDAEAAFADTRPTDEEIILFWKEKRGGHPGFKH